MENHFLKTVFLLLFLILFPSNGNAQFPPPPCPPPNLIGFNDLDINNVKAHFRASGSMWFNTYSHAPGYEIPKGSGNHSFFSFDIWMSSIDEYRQKRVAWQSYGGLLSGRNYFPGPLNDSGTTSYDVCTDYDRVWKINKSDLDSFRLGLLEEIPKDILEWPARGNPHISFALERDLAPFIDTDNDGIYDPEIGDYPEIIGDQALWWVFNDQGGFNEYIQFLPTQLEVQVMAYAYNSDEALQNHTFYKYTFTNKSQSRLDSVMLGLSVDFDLGQFDDDYVGCDTTRNMGIAYNGDAQDGEYGEDIPMAAIKLLQGLQQIDGVYSDMYTFWYRGGDFTSWDRPNNKAEVAYGLLGLAADGRNMTYGGNGQSGGTVPTLFMFPSDPTDEDGWSECTEGNPPADRSMLMSTGPVTLLPNEQKELHFAALWVRENIPHPCPSFAPIQEAADYVQDLFDKGIITNIEENPSSNAVSSQIRLFPNPINSRSSLQLEQTSETLQRGQFKLFDSLGRLVQNASLERKRVNELEVRELVSGVYFYQLEWERGGVKSGKLVVQ